MPGLTWDHTENIALALHEKFPDLDPTHIRYTDLHQWITELADFKDDPKASTEGKLEAIPGQSGVGALKLPFESTHSFCRAVSHRSPCPASILSPGIPR